MSTNISYLLIKGIAKSERALSKKIINMGYKVSSLAAAILRRWVGLRGLAGSTTVNYKELPV